MVGLVQFKKCEKYLWRSVTFSKVAGFSSPLCVPFTFFKLYKMYKIAKRSIYMSGILQSKRLRRGRKLKQVALKIFNCII